MFPDLAAEQAHLDASRRSRDSMIERLSAVDPDGAADEITKDYIEVTVADALADLQSPGAGDFFGRIDTSDADTDAHAGAGSVADSGSGSGSDSDAGSVSLDRWYIGRRHIENDNHDPMVVDWRAPIAAPFYRATAVDPLGVDFRRRFTLTDGQLTAYLDEQLDDPDGDVAAGIPDPVLAEIGAERSGEMREIVATIQGEQDVVIRADIDQVLVVQGGPGTGKTAVALHRAAYLLFEHRSRLARDGVLVVGPNRAFLDYIGNVLPSLGERSVRQTTVDDLCIPRVEVTGTDDVEMARWKGAPERLVDIEQLALAAISPPDDDIVVPIGVRNHVITVDEIRGWLDTAQAGTSPINERRVRVTALAKRALLQRTGDDGAWASAAPLKSAINKAWPTQKPVKLIDSMLPGPKGKKRVWTRADQLLVDEANSLLNGSPFTYGHVVVDEAQDHSAVALRVIGRRSPSGSMTLVGDVAQSTTPAGQQRWASVFAHVRPVGEAALGELDFEAEASLTTASMGDRRVGSVADLTIGYGVPEPIIDVANRLLPFSGVDATESRSVRTVGEPPTWHRVDTAALMRQVVDTVRATRRRHRLTGVVVFGELRASTIEALADVGLTAVDHVHELGHDEVPVFGAEEVKGLEFDGVVVVNPHSILHEGGDAPTPRGARLLYVAMTRAVQQLGFVTDAPPPAVVAP